MRKRNLDEFEEIPFATQSMIDVLLVLDLMPFCSNIHRTGANIPPPCGAANYDDFFGAGGSESEFTSMVASDASTACSEPWKKSSGDSPILFASSMMFCLI